MPYSTLYRQYRPQFFREVVGQDHIIQTLQNQVKKERIAHAYLFSGTRGTGKTTVAKIFAHAINCSHNEQGEPCGKCPSCLSTLDQNPDIFEIDAASNNGINEMRELRERVRFAPIESKYKIYILDEAHMITHDAFNALLKTLEEPPQHAIFILATTEPQRLPSTILSRCQRFEFHPIAINTIVEQIKNILADFSVKMDEESLLAIARAAHGGLRDALSITDQCLSVCQQEENSSFVSYEQVLDVLGSMNPDFIFQVADALIQMSCSEALQLLNHVLEIGRDISVFFNDILQHFRSLMLIQSAGDNAKQLLDCTEATFLRYQTQAKQVSLSYLLRAVSLLSNVESEMKWMTDPRIVLETCFVRLCFSDERASLQAVLERLDRLEKNQRTLDDLNISSQQPTASPSSSPLLPSQSTPDIPSTDGADSLCEEIIIPLPTDDDLPIQSPLVDDTPPWEDEQQPAFKLPPEMPIQAPLLFDDVTIKTENDDAHAIFQALITKQSDAIRRIFTLYPWDARLLPNNILELIAPKNCLPTLVKSLASQTEALAQSISEQYPTISILVSDSSTQRPATPKNTDGDLYQQTIDLFGAENVKKNNPEDLPQN